MLPVRGSVASAVVSGVTISTSTDCRAPSSAVPQMAGMPSSRCGDAIHRLWLQEPPAAGSLLAVELPLDVDFDVRMQAAHRLWAALEERPVGPRFPRCLLSVGSGLRSPTRAGCDGRRATPIAQSQRACFGKDRIPDRAWKTHDLRNRTIRLVQSGFALMRGGYRDLLRQSRRKK